MTIRNKPISNSNCVHCSVGLILRMRYSNKQKGMKEQINMYSHIHFYTMPAAQHKLYQNTHSKEEKYVP